MADRWLIEIYSELVSQIEKWINENEKRLGTIQLKLVKSIIGWLTYGLGADKNVIQQLEKICRNSLHNTSW